MKKIEVKILNPESINQAEKLMVCAARLTQRRHQILLLKAGKSVERGHLVELASPESYDEKFVQRDANRFLGFTAQQTLDYTQSLYEKKLVRGGVTWHLSGIGERHILDEDRRKNAELLENTFYNKENLNLQMKE